MIKYTSELSLVFLFRIISTNKANIPWFSQVDLIGTTGALTYGMRILNCKFHWVTYDDVFQKARQCLNGGERGHFTTVNVAILMALRSNSRLREFVDRSLLTVADGQPIVWLSSLLGKPLPQRVTGVDLIEGLCRTAVETNSSVYFLGSRNKVVRQMVKQIQQQIPNLDIAGFHDGYFPDTDAAKRVDEIRQSGAALLLVGLGAPKQEAFIEDHWEQLGVQLAIPIGGAFDMLTGEKPRAPVWMQASGLEWLWRLMLEPKRLAGRYFSTGTSFLVHAAIALWNRKFNSELKSSIQ